ncbi:MAG: sigma-70 family RNA polymerase sigma factor [Myxococcales bacterium]|nr:sigma-70 family RNA polymerase sigma factor [Myxococcales bacterium]
MKASCDATELASLVRAGDLTALDRLTRCHGDRLIAVGLRWCRNREEAEDAVQDALVAAGTTLDAWRGDGPVEAWILRIVRNACYRQRRGRKNDPDLHRTEVELTSLEDDPEKRAQSGEIARRVGEALETLSPSDRALMLMVHGQGLTPTEVAEATGLAPGTVRVRLSRARARVRQRLGPLADAA